MTRDDVIRTVKAYILTTFLPGEDPRALTEETELVAGGILDSLATLNLVTFLETQYGIELQAHEMDVTNLGSLSAIAALVQAKLAARG